MKKFGTFGGVFTPSLLTILGVIMYLRMGWVVANAGTLVMVVAIILLAHVVSVTTGLSISSIATDKKIKSGGIYFILSRSLGFPFGGAIGLTLYIATALSISLYIIGFSESLLLVIKDWLPIDEISINHLRIVGTISLMAITVIALISTSFAIKTQYLILTAIALSLISIFFGTSEGKGFDFSVANLENAPSFGVIFGIFFPAVTGFTAGVAMSGDLKTPETSIPWGTLLAISTGLIIYLGLSVFIYFNIPGAELLSNNNALVEFSWIPQLVIAGIWGATLSSALGGILGGPRILQSMSVDEITPAIFGRGVGKDNEPRNALLLTFLLSEMGVLIGELNVIAGVVAMFYMAAYLVINLSCFLEMWASPDFRPKFKINIFIPLLGVVTIFLLMIQLNLIATLASVVIIAGVFVYLTRKELVLSSGDVWSSVWFSVVKLGLKSLDQKPKNKRNWEPNILVFSGETEARPHLITFSKAIAGRGGIISNFDLIENPTAETLFPKREQAMEQRNFEDGIIFQRKQECKSLYLGVETIASTYGFSGIEPNTTLMGWARNTSNPVEFAKLHQKLNALDYNILYLDYDRNKGFGAFNSIDIWWNDLNNVSELTIQIAKRVLASDDWNEADIRILYLNNNHEKHIIRSIIKKRFEMLRIDFPFHIIDNEENTKPFYDVVKEYSSETDLLIVEIPKLKSGAESVFISETNNFLSQVGTSLLVSASDNFTENSKMLLDFEHGYRKEHRQIEHQPTDIKPLKISGFSTLDEYIKQIDESFISLNEYISTDIYSSLADTYKSFFGLLKERLEANEDKTALSCLEIKLNLIVDLFSSQRFDPVAVKIKNVISDHLIETQKLLSYIPKSISRHYNDEDLVVNTNDSEAIKKAKGLLLKTKTENIKLLNTVTDYYENEYLERLSQQLLFIGSSTKEITDNFIKWVYNLDETKPIDFTTQENQLEDLFNSLTTENLTNLNNISRELFNDVITASDTLDVENADIVNNLKLNKGNPKAILEFCNNYSQTWLDNTLLLTNQLSLSVQLRIMRIKSSKNIIETAQTIEKNLLDKTIQIVKKHNQSRSELSIEAVNEFKNEIFRVSNQITIDNAFDYVQQELENNISLISETLNVIAPSQMSTFDSEQENITPTTIHVRRLVKSIIENEIIASITDLYLEVINEGRSENTKLENVLELLKYSLQIKTNDEKKTNVILQKIKGQCAETLLNIEAVKARFNTDVKELLKKLKDLLAVYTITERAGDFEILFQKMRQKKILDNINAHIDKWASRIYSFFEKSIDTVADSEFKFKAKSLQNPQGIFADFTEQVSLSRKTEKRLPFYYKQLFTENHTVEIKFIENRKSELIAVKKAVDRFNEGKNGAILFTGDPLSGKTYLVQNAVSLYFPKNIISIVAPTRDRVMNKEILDNAFVNATGLKGDATSILKQVKKKSTIIFQDLELWWTRSTTGSECIIQIIQLIKQFSSTHLFILECNTLFYRHIRQHLPIDNHLLETIVTASLPISEIKKAIMKQHHIGGVDFIWKNKTEDELRLREINNIFKIITAQTEGNIGMALYMWIGSISSFEKNEIHFSDFSLRELPTITKPEWENMLVQILMHKRISLSRLSEVYRYENKYDVENNLQSLIRTGLVVKTIANSYSISPYILPYLLKYLHKKF